MKRQSARLPLLALLFLTTSLIIFSPAKLSTVAAVESKIDKSTVDNRQFVGCWSSGGYSLYIADRGGELVGKIRCNCEDPQKIYDISVEGTTITGKWESDPHYGPEKKKRRGIFMMTLGEGSLNGTAKETDESEVEAFRGRTWPWDWTRRRDTQMCDDAK